MVYSLTSARPQQIAKLHECLTELIQIWSNDWGIAPADLCETQIQSTSDADQIPISWTMLQPEQLYLGTSSHSSHEAAISALMYPSQRLSTRQTGPIGATMGNAASQDLIRRLLALFEQGGQKQSTQIVQAPCKTPSYWHSRWSGTVFAELRWASVCLMLSVGADLLCALAPLKSSRQPKTNRQTKASLSTALAGVFIPHRVEFLPQTIKIDDLIGMKAGDVLMTKHGLGQRVMVRNKRDQTVLYGDLGQLDGHYALSIAPTHHLSP